MKKNLIIFLMMLCISVVKGQTTFTFETDVPSSWTSSGSGALSVNTEHYKEGAQSLCWQTTGVTTLTVTTSFTTGTTNSAYMQIYSPEITNDTLQVEFLNGATVKRTAVYLSNYKGWHEFNRTYTEYASSTSTAITLVRFTIHPCSLTASRKIYFDHVDFNHATDAKRIMGSHWLLDKKYFKSTTAAKNDTSSLVLYANVVDIPVVTPTAQELAALNSLRGTLPRIPTAGNSTTLDDAKAYANSLNIVRNADGSVHGNVIDASASSLTDAVMTTLVKRIEVLAADALVNASSKTLFQNLIDHVLDQGISEGCNYMTFSNSYGPCRDIPAGFLDALPACTAAEKAEVLKLVKWFSFYGTMYYPQSTYLTKLVSDVVYLFLPHMMGIALNQADDATSVRELKAFKRYLDRNTEYVPGGGDILKPDGTGFHHGVNYYAYMYAYKTWFDFIYYVKGTPFKIETASYQRFKKAILTAYTMGTLDRDDVRYFCNALSGRSPFNLTVNFSKAQFDKLVAVGTDCLGSQDNEIASAYNYFFKTSKYTAPVQKYEGFYQFNYSPTGIFRKENWVASMHAPTTKFWGAEIYDNTNRFGRYQSNGSLEIMYSGTLASSGYPSSSATSGGWDWNVVPGATTVFYTSWKDMMPYGSTTGRFDQRTKTKNFSGALSFGDCGMFACDFDQIDNWSTTAFTATNLVFKKSMFAFDNLIISLGSAISSSGTYGSDQITATNLFQNIVSSGNLIFNGITKTSPYTSTTSTTADNWLITPLGTGYFIPKGNDPIEIRYDNQTTPLSSGADYAAPTTTVLAAKAYLNHGVMPNSKSYSFVVVPATDAASMQTLATQMANGGGSVYQVLSQDDKVHALLYKPSNTTAYTFFAAASDLTYGIVQATTAPHLLMDKYDATLNRHEFAISDPDLHPTTDAMYGWISSPRQTTLTLKGKWQLQSPVDGVTAHEPSNGVTMLDVTLTDGAPVYFSVQAIKTIFLLETGNSGSKTWRTAGTDEIKVNLKTLGKSLTKWLKSGSFVAEDKIWLAGGIYDIDTAFVMTGSNLSNLYGGFEGTETNPSQRQKGSNVWDFIHETTINASGSSTGVLAATDSMRMIVDGLTFTASLTSNVGPVLLQQPHMTVQNCKFTNNNSLCIKYTAADASLDAAVVDCYFSNNTTSTQTATCLYANNSSSGGNYLIDHCLFDSNSHTTDDLPPNLESYTPTGTGISGALKCYGTGNTNITNCIFKNNSGTGGNASAILLSSPTANLVNCLVYNTPEGNNPALFITSGRVMNCTFANNPAGGIMVSNNIASNVTLDNSVFWGTDGSATSGSGAIQCTSGTAATITNCAYNGIQRTQTPAPTATIGLTTGSVGLFNDYSNADFSLTSGSRLIDAGSSTGAPAKDLNGVSRAQGSTYDIGAYEAITTTINASTLALKPDYSISLLNGSTLVIDANTSVNALTVTGGGRVTLNSGKTLTALTLQLNSDANGTGTFVDANTAGGLTVTGTTKVNQYLTSGRNWYMASPVSGASVEEVNAITGGSIVSYDETHGSTPSSRWVTESATLAAGKGYIVASPTNPTISFSGALTTGPKQVNLTRTFGQDKEGFNLIGNPYASYVNWELAAKTNVGSTIWYRTKNTSGTYIFDTYNSGTGTNNNLSGAVTGLIPPMQAVWARVNAGQATGIVTFENAMRSHASDSTTLLKSKSVVETAQQIVRLQVSNGINSDEAILLVNPNASNDFDAYDATKMTNDNATIPEIYTTTGTENLVINGLNAITMDEPLPLGFTTGAANTFRLKATQVSNFDSGVRIILKDNLLNTEQDMTDGATYTFTSAIANTTSRFSVVFKSVSSTSDLKYTTGNQVILIYKNASNQIAIYCKGDISQDAKVSVFNSIGHKLKTKQITDANTVISSVFAPGIYLVTVYNGGRSTTAKIKLD